VFNSGGRRWRGRGLPLPPVEPGRKVVTLPRPISLNIQSFLKFRFLVWIVLFIVCTDLGSALEPFPEDPLNFCESEVIPTIRNGLQHFLLALELSILDLVLQHAKHPKVARTYVWRIRWVWSSCDASLVEFVSDFVTILMPSIVHVN
jgi:hypothetical protein